MLKQLKFSFVSLLLAGLLWGVSTGAAQEPGRIVGRVISSQTAEPLASAQVSIPSIERGVLTGVDGRYVLRDLPPGTYDIQINSLGFGTKTVSGVQVQAGQSNELAITMDPQAVAIEGIVVSAAAERGSTTSLLTERRRAAIVSDAIGRDQISRAPDGDAAAALRRVPGLSVVDGKFAYVRGLGERYSSTTLNDAPLASPIPDKKVIPLDVIPSSLLESIVTAKSYSPDQPGDYAGGLVQLRTRAFPATRILSLSAGMGWNSVSTFNEAPTYDAGSRTDFLGFDDGARDLPAPIPADVRVTRGVFSPDQLQSIGRAFGGDWGPTPANLPPNTSFGLTYGDDFDIDDERRLGFISSVNYSNGWSARDGWVERVFAGANAGEPVVDYTGQLSEHAVQWGGLLNLTVQPRVSDQVTFAAVYNRLTEDIARSLQGFNLDSNTPQLNTRIQYLAQELVNLQLKGEHDLGFLRGADLEWRGAYTSAGRYEPNTREVLYREAGGLFVFDDFVQSGSIFHQNLDDTGWNAGGSLTIPYRLFGLEASIKTGASTDRKERDVFTRRFRFRPERGGILTTEVLSLGPNELLSEQYISPQGFQIEEATFATDNYDATETIDAGYILTDLPIGSRIRVNGGVRWERSDQEVNTVDLFATGIEQLPGADLEGTDLLPAVNLTYSVSETMNVRGSLSRTLGRPQLRELAPFAFADYAGGYLVTGNPTLGRARILNSDVRFEWFPDPQSVFAISAFYKEFEDPIEVLVFPSTELIKTWVNAESATNYGAEMEMRLNFGFLGGFGEDLQFNGNLTLVESEVNAGGVNTIYIPGLGPTSIQTVDRPRPLQGQSPYVANAGLTWFDPSSEMSASLLFNRFGERIDAVGRESSPDIYEEARSQLDIVVERPFRDLKVKASATRLLGNEVTFTQGDGVLRQYDLGRSLSLSVSWEP